MREKRDEIIILRTTKAEKNRIYEKMLGMGIRSLSAYIRKMALDGYCLNLDLPQLRRMAYLLQMCSNNLNQYAKAANENGRVYAADMEDLRQRLDELIDIGKQILSKLAEKSARLAELNAQLDVDEKSHDPEQDEEEQEDTPRRPSVLAALEEKSDKPEPVKPFRSYYDKDGDAR